MSPEVTVVVVSWRQRELARRCLASLSHQSTPHKLVVVDNDSQDGTAEMVETEFPHARVLRCASNSGFAGGMVAAMAEVETRFVALLNNDAEADPHWLTESLRRLDARDVAAVSSKMLLHDEAEEGRAVINNAGVVLLSSGYGADRGIGEMDGRPFADPVEVFGFSGGGAVLRTLAVKAVGGFDPDYFMYYEDTDLSWRLRLAGWRVEYCPRAVVHHRHATSSDPGSASFAFHNERNRLSMVARNAPLSFAVQVWLRFCLTTASLAVSRLMGRTVPDAPVFDTNVRVRVLVSATRRLPRTVRSRMLAPWGQDRGRRVLREWLGVDSRAVATARSA